MSDVIITPRPVPLVDKRQVVQAPPRPAPPPPPPRPTPVPPPPRIHSGQRHASRASAGIQHRGQTQTNQTDMGFLKKLGRGLGTIAKSLIPGPFDDIIIDTASSALFGGGGKKLVKQSQLPANPARFAQQGVPPPALPGVPSFFPDFPGIPDLGDVEQFFRGGDPRKPGGILNFGQPMNGRNGTTFGSQGLLPNSIVVEPMQTVRNKAPKGYVIVDMPDGSGKKAVLKSVARSLGLWKPAKKPPISASEWNKLKTADRVRKKAKKIAMTADFKCVKK